MPGQDRLVILGTCSGTEPMPNRHHTAFAIEHEGRLFWFDAGEGCAYNAHLSGLNLPAIEAIFISHTHMDHIGGLPHLLWTLRKLTSVSECGRQSLAGRGIQLFIPDLDVYRGLQQVLLGTEGGFKTVFAIEARLCEDGVLYDRHGVVVRALHNHHLDHLRGADAPHRSFSFRVEIGAKRVVYSGDVKRPADLADLLADCDVLLMETGHHKVEDVCRYLAESGHVPGRLVFIHHGRAILSDPEGELGKARGILGPRVLVADDGLIVEL